jgi:hypothetical protein
MRGVRGLLLLPNLSPRLVNDGQSAYLNEFFIFLMSKKNGAGFHREHPDIDRILTGSKAPSLAILSD